MGFNNEKLLRNVLITHTQLDRLVNLGSDDEAKKKRYKK